MKIQKAVKKALEVDGFIARKSIYKESGTCKTVIKPTNSYDTCIIMTIEKGREIKSSRNWNPTVDDLLATDWKVYKIKGEKFYVYPDYIKLGLETL